MSVLKPSDFAEFFRAVYDDREPFPWQHRLAERVCGHADAADLWPHCIALPTAAGKTACIDIAVFALACQAELPPEKRKSPRRVFFVVDRRVVVDQAYEHASKLAAALTEPKTDILHRVADALRRVGADKDRPLDVYALRGGMYRESAWVRSPLQPTIITSTVDQVGSRLLFRGYGVSDSCKPLHAALVGNDSLILLDEAHCARPFDQTMTLVKKYREWTPEEHRLPSPFHFVTMTATPTKDILEEEERRKTEQPKSMSLIFELDDKDRDPKGPLGIRIGASKPAALAIAAQAKGNKWRKELVKELVLHVCALQSEGFRAVGVIVNRVATARESAAALRERLGDAADVILLTGRMRPMDRDAIMTRLEPLFAGRSGELSKPTCVVATQCLEVGADLDFHGLVTECAGLDALRQRFGRLNRIAARSLAKAVIVVRGDQTEPTEEEADADPVYGNSLAQTWKWLEKHAQGAVFDFGVAAVRKLTEDMKPEGLAALNAPAPDAAVLLPAHLDAWCQTSPRPMPDPDPSYFLHGPQRGEPEVQVIFRSDLGDDNTRWGEIVSLCPPSSSEALPVRLGVFTRWLANEDAEDDSSDIEGERQSASDGDDDTLTTTPRRALRWRGPDSDYTRIVESLSDLYRGGRPHDLYIVPIGMETGLNGLGDFPDELVTDQGDEAFQRSRDLAILRPSVLAVPVLVDVSIEDEELDKKVSEAIESLHAVETAKPQADQRPWLLRAALALSKKVNRTVKAHPCGGLILIGKKRLHQFDPTFVEPEDSWEAASDHPYALVQHCRDVAERAKSFAKQSALAAHAEAIEVAGRLHDAGKADPRFQAWLHGGNRRKADVFPYSLAKSIVSMPTRKARTEARIRAGYPEGGRHELLSVRLAEHKEALPASLTPNDRDLILHLIAAHHGSCRPFSPVIDDPNPVTVNCRLDGTNLAASSATALERLDSGVAERFWTLTRRFGWWGLPWIESMLRLGDWSASEAAAANGSADKEGKS